MSITEHLPLHTKGLTILLDSNLLFWPNFIRRFSPSSKFYVSIIKSKTNEEQLIVGKILLLKNQFSVYNLGDTGVNVVHAGDPFHLVGGF